MPYCDTRCQIAIHSITIDGRSASQNCRVKAPTQRWSGSSAMGCTSRMAVMPAMATPETSQPTHPLGHCQVTTTLPR